MLSIDYDYCVPWVSKLVFWVIKAVNASKIIPIQAICPFGAIGQKGSGNTLFNHQTEDFV